MPPKEKAKGLEVSSSQITEQLIEIKERISALETIASLANRKEVEAYVVDIVKTPIVKKLMAFCEQPRTKEQLRKLMNLKSVQALDNHLNPLRKDDLLKQEFNDHDLITLEWSNLFKRLPRKDRERILLDDRLTPRATNQGDTR